MTTTVGWVEASASASPQNQISPSGVSKDLCSKISATRKNGGCWGIRTHDPLIKSQLLYQLS